MGGSSCGPGAHLIHLWPPQFAFSDHHLGNLGPHSGPALVRTRWWKRKKDAETDAATCFLCGSSISSPLVSLLSPVNLMCLYVLAIFLPLPPCSVPSPPCVFPRSSISMWQTFITQSPSSGSYRGLKYLLQEASLNAPHSFLISSCASSVSSSASPLTSSFLSEWVEGEGE